jgi:hypothetical protein
VLVTEAAAEEQHNRDAEATAALKEALPGMIALIGSPMPSSNGRALTWDQREQYARMLREDVRPYDREPTGDSPT